MKFFYICLASFVLVVVSSFIINTPRNEPFLAQEEVAGINTQAPQQFRVEPVLSGTVDFPVLSAQAVIALDVDSGVSLYEKNPDEPFLPASTTKIITALVAMNHYSLGQVLEVKNPKVDGQKMGLVAGEKINVESLLYGLLVYSANDAAEVLAQNFCIPQSSAAIGGEMGSCGREAFILAMNSKAESLGMVNSHFANPTGLDTTSGSVHTTARDLIVVSKAAMEDTEFAKIVGTREITVTSTDGKFVHRLKNINELLGEVDGVIGVKTGWTENARENLVTYVVRENKKVMIALLGSQDRFGETKELINWIFENYNWKQVAVSD
jgi:D-alanyl-D-alanine carboxypeptidase (penicillin-binding protein 5/6)